MLHKFSDALSTFGLRKAPPVDLESAMRQLEAQHAAEDALIPSVPLQSRHIRNLKVVLDRSEFLDYMPKNGVAAEIGIAHGDFSAMILERTSPRLLHLIDYFDSRDTSAGQYDEIAARFAPQVAAGEVVIHKGLSTDALAKFPDAYFDWVYLDTGHDYASTVLELELCRHKVKPDGIIAGHDYVTGAWSGWYRYGVVEAVHAVCVEHDYEMLYLTHEPHRHLSFALRALGSQ
jgi:SAM-dependent methyltransferase